MIINKNLHLQENSKVLIVRLSAIGDVIHSLPVISALKATYPNIYIGWAVEDRASDVIIDNPLIDKAFVFPKSKWKKSKDKIQTLKEFSALIKEIKDEKFDVAIDLQELFKSGLITYLSGAKRRIAHAKTREFAEIFVNEKLPAHDTFDQNKLIIERYLESAQYLGAKTNEIEFSLPLIKQETIEKVDKLLLEINKDKPTVVFIPGTIWETKHWIDEYWAKLLDELSSSCNIIFVGAGKDDQLYEKIISLAPNKNNLSLINKTTVFDLIEIFNRTDMVVATDTGPAHIANAVGKPVIITLFGATSYKRSCPVGENHTALCANIECQPCFNRKCKLKDEKMRCMMMLTPEIVLEKIHSKLTLLK